MDKRMLVNVWAGELAGYTPDEIKRGLTAKYQFPPSCDEFCLACRPPINPDAAFGEAVTQIRRRKTGLDSWSNPAIYWATTHFATEEIGSTEYHVIRRRWVAALNTEIDAVKTGKRPAEVPARPVEPKRIEHEFIADSPEFDLLGRSRGEVEAGNRMLQKVYAMLHDPNFVPEPGAAFTPHWEYCHLHGKWQANEWDVKSQCERWRPVCPDCRRAKVAA